MNQITITLDSKTLKSLKKRTTNAEGYILTLIHNDLSFSGHDVRELSLEEVSPQLQKKKEYAEKMGMEPLVSI